MNQPSHRIREYPIREEQGTSQFQTGRNRISEQLITHHQTTFENRPELPFVIEDQILEIDGRKALDQDEFSGSSSSSSQRAAHSHNIVQHQFPIKKDQVIEQTKETKVGGWTNQAWKKGALRIMTFVVKFVTFILTNSEKFKFTFINQKQFTAINDRSSSYEYYLENKLIRERIKKKVKKQLIDYIVRTHCFKLIRYLLEHSLLRIIRVIDPSSTPKIIFDIFYLAVLSIQMIFVPLRICFKLDISDPVQYFFLIALPLFAYIVDIVFNFITGYYEHGSLINDQRTIALHYLYSSFGYDLINLMPFMWDVMQTDYLPSFLQFIILVRLDRVREIADSLEEQLNLRENFSTSIDVSRMLLQFLFIAHLFGCVWHYIAILEIEAGEENNWLNTSGKQNEAWYVRYVISIYWSSITTLTIGYGDIIPITFVEKIFVIIVAVISSVVFGYTISYIGQIFSQINENKKQQRYKMSLVNSFVSQRGVNKALQLKVKKFFEYFIKIDQSKDAESDTIMLQLAPHLRKELKIDIYKKFILTSKLFRITFSTEFIEKLCELIQEKSCTPEETVFQANTQLNELYFIIKGDVQLIVEMSKQSAIKYKQLTIIKKNHVLGERSFVTNSMTTYSAKAVSFTRLAYISKSNFEDLLLAYPEEMEKFQHSQNKVIMNEQIKFQGCEFCFQNHQVLSCPFVFYQPNIRKVVKRINAQVQKRIYRERYGVKLHKTFIHKQWYQECAISFALENNYMHEESLDESAMHRYDTPFIEPTPNKLKQQQTTESSGNTLLNNNQTLNNNMNSSNNDNNSIEKAEKMVRQGSNNKVLNNMRTSVKHLNQKKLLRFSKKIDVRPPDKVQLQDVSEDEDSPQQFGLMKRSASSSATKQSTMDVAQVLYQDFLNLYQSEEAVDLDRYREYQHYYPKNNLSTTLTDYHNNMQIIKKKKTKHRYRKNARIINSIQNLGGSGNGERRTQVNLNYTNRPRKSQLGDLFQNVDEMSRFKADEMSKYNADEMSKFKLDELSICKPEIKKSKYHGQLK